MTSVTTKQGAEGDAGLAERQDDVPDDAPARRRRRRCAASSSDLSMRAIELKIGTIMNSVNRWT